MPLSSFLADGQPADSMLLRAVVDTAGSVILGLRPDHTIFAWNRAAEVLYQTPREQAIGLNYIATFIVEAHRAAVAADIEQVLAGKLTLNFEDDSILPDGSVRTLIWNVTRILDADGTPSGILAIGQDISERKQAEQRFRLIFEHAQDGLLLADDTGVLDCNPAALRLLGLADKAELIGRRPAEFSPVLQPDGQRSDEKSRAIGALTKAHGQLSFDWEHRSTNGQIVPVRVSVQHATMDNRRISVVAWHDLSRQREMEREREELQRRLHLAQKMEAVGQLAGGLAHDFNNLLATIRNTIDLAVEQLPADAASVEDLRTAQETTARAARLTQQLLAFSRRQPLVREQLDLAALVAETEPLFRSTLPMGVTLVLSHGAKPAVVEADRGQLEQVLLNLVLNARDAMPHGGTLAISVAVDDTQHTAELVVRDSGVGMDGETLARAFEPFFTTKPLGEGNGLGLAVAYGVVTQAGGTITAESCVGAGTTLRVVLPLSQKSASSPPPPHEDATDAPRTVLLVDDDALVRGTTARMLKSQGWKVLVADNGEEGWRQFCESTAPIAVVLTDIRMPGLDGIGLIERLRARAPQCPVVVFSGFDASVDGRVQTIREVEFLQKPFSRRALIDALRAAQERMITR